MPPMNPAELKQHRQAKKMTQKQFSEWLEVSKDTVISWENGRNKIPGWVARRVNVDSLNLKPWLDDAYLVKAKQAADEEGLTLEEWIAKLVKSAVGFVIFIGCAYALLS